jgi:hypothetical protein
MQICQSFFMRAERRIEANFKAIDRNDDDPIKYLADRAYELGTYPFDILKG